jgi:predicted PurR-regulated permease PerM
VFGPLGLLLALPLAVCVQVIVREVVIHDLLDPWKRRRSSL